MRLSYPHILLFATFFFHCAQIDRNERSDLESPIPSYLIGDFEDDYEIQYSINDSTFILQPDAIYHIDKWELEQQYLIAQNDSSNEYDTGLWSRIDWIQLADMEPYSWAFCLSVYNASTADEAELSAKVNPETPRTGCNGFPFSRMARIDSIHITTDSY